MSAINKAVEIVGGKSALAKRLGVAYQQVQQWCEANRVPPKWAIPIENATDGQVTRYALRPDVFGKSAA